MRAGSFEFPAFFSLYVESVALAPVEFTILSLQRCLMGTAVWTITPELARHLVAEVAAVDIRHCEDKAARLAVRVSKVCVCALGTQIQTVVCKARLAVADCLLPKLLTLTVAVASLGSTLFFARASLCARSCGRIEGEACAACTAVSARVWPLALATLCLLVATECAWPVAEASGGTYLRAVAEVCRVPVWALAEHGRLKVERVAPASSEAASWEIEKKHAWVTR